MMIAFRKAHPSLTRSRFSREEVSWYGTGPVADLSFASHSIAFVLHGASRMDNDLYVMVDGYWKDLEFEIQEGPAAYWQRIVDPSLDAPVDYLEPGAAKILTCLRYQVSARSVVILQRAFQSATARSAMQAS